MIYIEAPQVYTGSRPSIFLAGGITNCPNWQLEAKELLKESNFAVFNPRRDDFPIDDPNASYDQIKWEYDHLQRATIRLFWFTAGSLQPIALFELGRWSWVQNAPIIVGADPNYERYQDVEIQMQLARPSLSLYNNLEEMIQRILDEKSKEEAARAYRQAAYQFYNG